MKLTYKYKQLLYSLKEDIETTNFNILLKGAKIEVRKNIVKSVPRTVAKIYNHYLIYLEKEDFKNNSQELCSSELILLEIKFILVDSLYEDNSRRNISTTFFYENWLKAINTLFIMDPIPSTFFSITGSMQHLVKSFRSNKWFSEKKITKEDENINKTLHRDILYGFSDIEIRNMREADLNPGGLAQSFYIDDEGTFDERVTVKGIFEKNIWESEKFSIAEKHAIQCLRNILARTIKFRQYFIQFLYKDLIMEDDNKIFEFKKQQNELLQLNASIKMRENIIKYYKSYHTDYISYYIKEKKIPPELNQQVEKLFLSMKA